VVAGVEATFNGSIATYAVCAIVVSCLVVVHAATVLCLFFLTSGLLLMVMVHFGQAPLRFIASHPNFVGLIVFCFVASRLFYRTRLQWWTDRQRLQEEVQRRKDAEADLKALNRQLGDYASRVGDDLKLSESRFQSLVKHSPGLIMTLSNSGKILFASRPLPGLEDRKAAGNSVDVVLPHRHRNEFMKAFHAAQSGQTVTVEHEALDGSEWVSRLVPLSRVHGCKEVMVISSDVTNRRETERRERELTERLQHAERMESLGLLAGGVAHDLNNILGPMVALPSIIREDLESMLPGGTESSDRIMSDLTVLESSALKATDVIRDLLTLGRRHSYEKESMDLSTVVQEGVDAPDLQAILDRRPSIRLEVNLCSEPLTITGSPSHIGRALTNVLRNAIEAVGEDGCLRINVRHEHLDQPAISFDDVVPAGDYAVVSISDTGPGIPPDALPRIFEPFYSKKGQDRSSGSGLGLAIVHGVMKDHQAYIDVSSVLGQGTRFSFYFPLSAGPTDTSAADDEVIRGGTERILVVDDDLTQRLLAERALRRLGYAVSVVSSGREAVTLFRSQGSPGSPPFDVVLLDMIMDGLDGLGTMRELRECCPTVQVVIVSGYAASDRVRRAQELGAGWLAKPYELKDLADAVREKLDNPVRTADMESEGSQ
jgi:PAS domain S-box-containing protein